MESYLSFQRFMQVFTADIIKPMKIAVLSGKGGAGKTFVSTNLAYVYKDSVYADTDVEEPDGYLYFKDEKVRESICNEMLPVFDAEKCTGCRECVKHCAFNALAYIAKKPLVFDEVCHSCGLCRIVCPEGAISEGKKEVGKVIYGKKTIYGLMNTGIASAVPLIANVLDEAEKYGATDIVIDCPPGSSCAVMESIKDVDYSIVVAEPTEFGIHNFLMIRELMETLHKKYGVVINKAPENRTRLEDLLDESGIEVLMRIPFSKEIADISNSGIIASSVNKEVEEDFIKLWDKIKERAV